MEEDVAVEEVVVEEVVVLNVDNRRFITRDPFMINSTQQYLHTLTKSEI